MNFSLSELQKIDLAALLKRKDILVILVILVLALLFSRAVYQKQSLKAEMLRQIVTEQSQINNLSLELDSLEASFAALQRNIPAGAISTAAIVDKISQIAKNRNITLSSISPKSQRDLGLYWEFPLDIEMNAEYRQIAFFLSDIEQQEEFFRVNNLSVNSQQMYAREEGITLPSIRISLSAFSWKK